MMYLINKTKESLNEMVGEINGVLKKTAEKTDVLHMDDESLQANIMTLRLVDRVTTLLDDCVRLETEIAEETERIDRKIEWMDRKLKKILEKLDQA